MRPPIWHQGLKGQSQDGTTTTYTQNEMNRNGNTVNQNPFTWVPTTSHAHVLSENGRRSLGNHQPSCDTPELSLPPSSQHPARFPIQKQPPRCTYPLTLPWSLPEPVVCPLPRCLPDSLSAWDFLKSLRRYSFSPKSFTITLWNHYRTHLLIIVLFFQNKSLLYISLYHVFEKEIKFACWWDGRVSLFLHKKLNHGWVVNTAGHRTRDLTGTFYFVIVSAENMP